VPEVVVKFKDGMVVRLDEIKFRDLKQILKKYPELMEEGSKIPVEALEDIVYYSIVEWPSEYETKEEFLENLPASRFLVLLEEVRKANPLFWETETE